uniref:40S ribosomal protein S17 n=1 Tax=Arcella intermedia TaxID=1963864 RepID=A0A6B2LQ12_9EUKA|eukprot:TRINITY_DN2271_c0_g1_i1.p1 TRINITY_DN2271_c0_g1~~TRINITY_DN2271_c0_g1_i1.p1  ORF type:complete len:146 (-),score=20.38 TRINITY_DN2271_c0_g1_i1:52-489(-)
MGRVRTKTVKKAAKLIVERYYPKLTLDFQVNKKITGEVALIATKRLRNKIAGYVTHLMIRISKGPVRGISLKLQEEERERRDNTVPKQSMMVKLVEDATIDEETQDMLKAIDFGALADTIPVAEKVTTYNNRGDRRVIPGSIKAK